MHASVLPFSKKSPFKTILRPILCLIIFSCALVFPLHAYSQSIAEIRNDKESANETHKEIGIKPTAKDEEIANRLQRILEATGWFSNVEVIVREGVVFLKGEASSTERQEWAGKLAGNTEAVVAVVNQMEVVEQKPWDITPLTVELKTLFSKMIRNSPLIFVGILILIITWYLTKWVVRTMSWLLKKQLKNRLVRGVVARIISVPIFLLGLYLMLQITGLTRVAFTVIGGTGLLGIFIGFAFRDIAENFFASILLGFQQPFAVGDLIEVAGCKGYVQGVNIRSTLLMTQDGNYVQIPNATVYKEKITNHTANPVSRYDFVIGIGYSDSIAKAQSLALSVIEEHPGVIQDPEPLVLVDHLGASAVNLRITFWTDISKFSYQKVRSALIRLVKNAFQEAGIGMPDEAREIIFPAGVPVNIVDMTKAKKEKKEKAVFVEMEEDVHEAEGGLSSEAEEIQEQADKSVQPEGEESNLLEDNNSSDS